MSDNSDQQNAATSSIAVRVPERRKPGSPKFVKGQSGNPAGKPKGTKNKLTLYRESVLMKQEKKLLQNLPEILDVVIEKAKSGDMVATKLFLDRVLAAKKVADENAEDKGQPVININITGTKARATMGRAVEADFEVLDSNDSDNEGEVTYE